MVSELCGLNPPKDEFEEFLGRVNELYGGSLFPNMAVWEVPKVLEEGTKERLIRLGVEEAGKVLIDSIEEINSGSTERLEILVRKRV